MRREGCSSFLSSNLDFKEEIWQRCEMMSAEFSFMQDVNKVDEEESQEVANFKLFAMKAQSFRGVKSPSEELTSASVKTPTRISRPMMIIEQDEVQPSFVCGGCLSDRTFCNLM